MLYVHMTYCRLISIINFMYEVALILLLVFSITPVDVIEPVLFISFLGGYLISGLITRMIFCAGGAGHDKSESGSGAFEVIFRYTTVKGLFVALFMGQSIRFKVTDKRNTNSNISRRPITLAQRAHARGLVIPVGDSRSSSSMDIADAGNKNGGMVTVNLNSSVIPPRNTDDNSESTDEARTARQNLGDLIDDILSGRFSTASHLSTEMNTGSLTTSGELGVMNQEAEENVRKSYFKQTRAERTTHHQNVLKNLKRVWFNILSFFILIFSVVWAFINPPLETVGSIPLPSLNRGP
eukprot:IDg17386t1